MITILYFGPLKRLQPEGRESLDWPAGDTEDLLDLLRQRGPDWADALRAERIFKLALNQRLLQGPEPIRDGDEIAILPPVTGG